MGGGYSPPSGDGSAPVVKAIADTRRQLRDVQRPPGDRLISLLKQVQQTLANIVSQVNTVATAWMVANSYTKAQIDSKIASPGAITPTNVTASGTVSSAGAFVSPGSRATIVTVGFVNAYLDGSGVLGYQPSTRSVKKDLEPIPESYQDALMAVTPQVGRYVWDDDDSPLKMFLIAEDVQEAGFGPDVVPLDEDGNAATVNSQNLIPALLAIIQRQEARITALESASAGN